MADLDDLLEKTSRTFALAIPLLPEPTHREVTLAYLLFRIADNFEDASRWPREKRIGALEDFAGLLTKRDDETTRRLAQTWGGEVPLDHAGYRELLAEVPAVLDAYWRLSPEARRLVGEHTARTAHGMAGFVARTGEDGELHLEDLADLRHYCYVVAGIVGEMLTELFLLGRPALAPIAGYLRQRSHQFGEALQLVNILKDSATDAREGRLYLPPGLPRDEIFALARRDLEVATEYTLALQRAGAERGLVAFNALPVELARASLDRVEEAGPGSKLSRPEVWALVERLERALDQGRPAIASRPRDRAVPSVS